MSNRIYYKSTTEVRVKHGWRRSVSTCCKPLQLLVCCARVRTQRTETNHHTTRNEAKDACARSRAARPRCRVQRRGLERRQQAHRMGLGGAGTSERRLGRISTATRWLSVPQDQAPARRASDKRDREQLQHHARPNGGVPVGSLLAVCVYRDGAARAQRCLLLREEDSPREQLPKLSDKKKRRTCGVHEHADGVRRGSEL